MNSRVFAPAKINLTLEVGRPRSDGFHPLQSAVMFASVGDWIEAAPGDALSLSITGAFAGALQNDDNLVLRAARLLAEAAGIEPRAALTLEKNLPVASGIGGGSSDAAAALKALVALWGLDANLPAAIAARLGADVPVCLSARSAWMTGVGEILEPLTAPVLEVVLVNPRSPLPTADVFRAFDALGLGAAFAPRSAPVWRNRDEVLADLAAWGNDLLPAARACSQSVRAVEQVLHAEASAHHVGLSGSGATFFCVTEDAPAATELAASLRTRFPDWWIEAAVLGAA